MRLPLGRFPSRAERDVFAESFASQHALKPSLVWGLLAVPQCRRGLLRLGEIAGHHIQAEQCGTTYQRFSDADGNFFTVWTGQPVAFMHFEKCGGSAFLAWIAQMFHPEQIHSDTYRDLPPHLFTRLPQAPVQQPLIRGHYDIQALQGLDPDRAVFTLLREPRERLVSLYYYWRSIDPAKIDSQMAFTLNYAHSLSLEDFLDLDDPCLVDSIDNIYTRRLTGFYATGAQQDRLKTDPEDALNRAITALKQLLYVGITEEMDRSAAGLAAKLGIKPPAQQVRGNVTAENHQDPSGWFRKISRPQHSPAVQAALDRRTELDQKLYAYARSNFEGPAK